MVPKLLDFQTAHSTTLLTYWTLLAQEQALIVTECGMHPTPEAQAEYDRVDAAMDAVEMYLADMDGDICAEIQDALFELTQGE